MWTKDQLVEISKKPSVVVGAVSVVSASAGATLGYLVAKKRLETRYEEIAQKDVEEARSYFKNLYKTTDDGKPMTPEDVMRERYGEDPAEEIPIEAKAALKVYSGGRSTAQEEADSAAYLETVEGRNVETKKTPVAKENVFEKASSWNYEAEQDLRNTNPGEPYILHEEEFMESEMDFEQEDMTYFEGDDTLIDSKEMPVQEIDATVGPRALVSFGHGALDPNTVFVRNERLEMEFEITRSHGYYQVEVLGMDEPDSLQHSHRRPRKFRDYDD